MSASHHSKVIIIGSGPAGYTAAIYAARAALAPILVQGLEPGGQLTITTDVENYPGFADVIQGPWLMEQMKAQAEHVGARLMHDLIVSVDFSRPPFTCVGDSGDLYSADSIIIATGAQARWLGLPSDEEFMGFGVSACATCDGFFFRGKEVAVIGGGNTAVEEALYLTNHADKVTLVHRRDSLRAEKILQDKLLAKDNISVEWDHTLEEVLGDDSGVTGMRIRSTKGEGSKDLDLQGVFIAIGHEPNTKLFAGQLELDERGYIVTHRGTATNVPGVFHVPSLSTNLPPGMPGASRVVSIERVEVTNWFQESGP